MRSIVCATVRKTFVVGYVEQSEAPFQGIKNLKSTVGIYMEFKSFVLEVTTTSKLAIWVPEICLTTEPRQKCLSTNVLKSL